MKILAESNYRYATSGILYEGKDYNKLWIYSRHIGDRYLLKFKVDKSINSIREAFDSIYDEKVGSYDFTNCYYKGVIVK